MVNRKHYSYIYILYPTIYIPYLHALSNYDARQAHPVVTHYLENQLRNASAAKPIPQKPKLFLKFNTMVRMLPCPYVPSLRLVSRFVLCAHACVCVCVCGSALLVKHAVSSTAVGGVLAAHPHLNIKEGLEAVKDYRVIHGEC